MIAFCQDKQRRDLVLQTRGSTASTIWRCWDRRAAARNWRITFLKDARTSRWPRKTSRLRETRRRRYRESRAQRPPIRSL